MKGETKKCAYYDCGKEFTAGSNNQKYCSLVCGVRARTRQEYQYKKPENETVTPHVKKTRYTDAEWEQLTPSQRWERMTWNELTAELARLHLSYGQARVMKERRELPFYFGEKRGAI